MRAVLAILAAAACGGPAAADDAAVAGQLRADVTALAGGIGARSVFQDDTLVRAERFTAGQLTQAGWEVTRQTYRVQGMECANLVAERKGASKPAEIVVIGPLVVLAGGLPGDDADGHGAVPEPALPPSG